MDLLPEAQKQVAGTIGTLMREVRKAQMDADRCANGGDFKRAKALTFQAALALDVVRVIADLANYGHVLTLVSGEPFVLTAEAARKLAEANEPPRDGTCLRCGEFIEQTKAGWLATERPGTDMRTCHENPAPDRINRVHQRMPPGLPS